MARWTRADYEHVLALRAEGKSGVAIAEETGVPKTRIYAWLKGRLPKAFSDERAAARVARKPKSERTAAGTVVEGSASETGYQRRKRHERERQALKIEAAEAQACRTRCVYCNWHFDGPMGLGKAALDQHRREGCSDDYPAPKGKPPEIVRPGSLITLFDIGAEITAGDPGELAEPEPAAAVA